MVQDAEPRCLEEGCGVSLDTAKPDERHSRPADCARSPRSTSDFGFKLLVVFMMPTGWHPRSTSDFGFKLLLSEAFRPAIKRP